MEYRIASWVPGIPNSSAGCNCKDGLQRTLLSSTLLLIRREGIFSLFTLKTRSAIVLSLCPRPGFESGF